MERFAKLPTIHLTPVLHHEFSFLPYLTLGRHVNLASRRDLQTCREVLDECSRSPVHSWVTEAYIDEERLGEAVLQELVELVSRERYEDLAELRTAWLPRRRSMASPNVLRIQDAARHCVAAQADTNPTHRLDQYERAHLLLTELAGELNRLFSDCDQDDPGFTEMKLIVRVFGDWSERVTDLYRRSQDAVDIEVKNPFRSSQPLQPTRDSSVFHGRTAVIEDIRQFLARDGHGSVVTLVGPWGIGKTSLLNALGESLPDTRCIVFSVLNNPVDSSRGLIEAIGRRLGTPTQYERLRREPDERSELRQLWKEVISGLSNDDRLLLCIDDCDYISPMLCEESEAIQQLIEILADPIIERDGMSLLLSGGEQFQAQCQGIHDAPTHQLSCLNRVSSRAVLCQPSSGERCMTITDVVADSVFIRTRGYPLLLQLFGFELIQLLYRTEREVASDTDVPVVEEQILKKYHSVFESMLNLVGTDRGFVKQGDFLFTEGQVSCNDFITQIPIVSRWIRETE